MRPPQDEQRLMEVAEYIARRTSSGQHRTLVLTQLARHTAYERHAHLAMTPERMATVESQTRLLFRQMQIRGYVE